MEIVKHVSDKKLSVADADVKHMRMLRDAVAYIRPITGSATVRPLIPGRGWPASSNLIHGS